MKMKQIDYLTLVVIFWFCFLESFFFLSYYSIFLSTRPMFYTEDQVTKENNNNKKNQKVYPSNFYT